MWAPCLNMSVLLLPAAAALLPMCGELPSIARWHWLLWQTRSNIEALYSVGQGVRVSPGRIDNIWLFNFAFFEAGTTLALHQIFLVLWEIASSQHQPACDLGRQFNAVFFDFSERFSMFSAIRHQCLVVAPGEVVEELLEWFGLFDPCIVAEGLVEDFDHLGMNPPSLSSLVDSTIGSTCFRSWQDCPEVNNSFLWFLLQNHLLLVEVNPSPPFLVILRPVAKGRHPRIFTCIPTRGWYNR